MSHSFVSCTVHCVFSTKMRQPFLTAKIRERLFPYITGEAHNHRIQVLASGGIENHIHLLLSLPADLSISKAIQFIKGASSRWIRVTFADLQHFAWQQGYSAFSIGISQRKKTTHYIYNQVQHHQKRSFEQELQAFYTRHGFTWENSVLD